MAKDKPDKDIKKRRRSLVEELEANNRQYTVWEYIKGHELNFFGSKAEDLDPSISLGEKYKDARPKQGIVNDVFQTALSPLLLLMPERRSWGRVPQLATWTVGASALGLYSGVTSVAGLTSIGTSIGSGVGWVIPGLTQTAAAGAVGGAFGGLATSLAALSAGPLLGVGLAAMGLTAVINHRTSVKQTRDYKAREFTRTKENLIRRATVADMKLEKLEPKRELQNQLKRSYDEVKELGRDIAELKRNELGPDFAGSGIRVAGDNGPLDWGVIDPDIRRDLLDRVNQTEKRLDLVAENLSKLSLKPSTPEYKALIKMSDNIQSLRVLLDARKDTDIREEFDNVQKSEKSMDKAIRKMKLSAPSEEVQMNKERVKIASDILKDFNSLQQEAQIHPGDRVNEIIARETEILSYSDNPKDLEKAVLRNPGLRHKFDDSSKIDLEDPWAEDSRAEDHERSRDQGRSTPATPGGAG